MKAQILSGLDKHSWKLAIIWTSLVVGASLMPSPDEYRPKFLEIPHLDKLVHFTFYCVMCFFWSFALQKKDSKLKAAILACFVCVSIGALVEIGQKYLTNTRSFEVYDMVANVIGALFGAAIFLQLEKILSIFVKHD